MLKIDTFDGWKKLFEFAIRFKLWHNQCIMWESKRLYKNIDRNKKFYRTLYQEKSKDKKVVQLIQQRHIKLYKKRKI